DAQGVRGAARELDRLARARLAAVAVGVVELDDDRRAAVRPERQLHGRDQLFGGGAVAAEIAARGDERAGAKQERLHPATLSWNRRTRSRAATPPSPARPRSSGAGSCSRGSARS